MDSSWAMKPWSQWGFWSSRSALRERIFTWMEIHFFNLYLFRVVSLRARFFRTALITLTPGADRFNHRLICRHWALSLAHGLSVVVMRAGPEIPALITIPALLLFMVVKFKRSWKLNPSVWCWSLHVFRQIRRKILFFEITWKNVTFWTVSRYERHSSRLSAGV